MGAPAVLGGLLAVHNGNVLVTAREYGLAVIVLAALAAAGLLRPRTAYPACCSAVPSAR
jgi:hypothetical protein